VNDAVPDTEYRGFTRLLPAAFRPYALLARFDRPIGWWLLFWPGAWAVALSGWATDRWDLILWLLLGSIGMRGAGCVYNDIVDRDLDRQVERTRSRPLASGAVPLKAAWIWLGALCLIGLLVLLQLKPFAAGVAMASLALVAAYPFMKRITWWPQAWLGLVFSWAALVGWAEAGDAPWEAGLLLYAGCVAWVIGYDTI
jgi:4-hydroxybenzoate polyprenyltransferase